jgi:molybdopterin-guanine dinucleotide biosynthesis protein A
MSRVLGLVIAGGRGRRMGTGVPKALLTLGGMTLLERTLRLVRSLCDDVLVCAPPSLGLPVAPEALVADLPAGGGPLAGLLAGLQARPFDRALALGVDLPLLRAGALRALGERLAGASADATAGTTAVVPAPNSIPQPLAAWYSPGAIPGILERFQSGERSLVQAVMGASPLIVRADALASLEGGEAAFLNVNTPADLELASRRLAEEAAA